MPTTPSDQPAESLMSVPQDPPGELLTSLRDGVFEITLNRPQQLNAVTRGLLEQLLSALTRAVTEPEAAVIVVRGRGRIFCAGADVKKFDDLDASLVVASQIISTIQSSPLPVVAAVQGPAVGFGCSLALASDVVLLRESAYLQLIFTKLGLMPDGGATATVAAAVGRARAMRMALFAEKISARTAEEWGLITRQYADAEFEAGIDRVVHALRIGPAEAFALTKLAINKTAMPHLAQALERESRGQRLLSRSDDFAEGLAALRDGRDAAFGRRKF